MRKQKVLSIMSYYGGKARMSKFIAERLNYDDSDIYIEPFGGACRVLLNKPRHKIEIYNDYSKGLCTIINLLSNYKTASDFIYELLETEYSEEEFNKSKQVYKNLEMSNYVSNNLLSNISLAKATYIVFSQSKNSMGEIWSNSKFKSNIHYHNQMQRLFDCAERLEGISVSRKDARIFFEKEETENGWYYNPKAMIYCDPSYIDCKSEAKLLEGIDWKHTDNLSEAIIKKNNGKLPKNLGKSYTMSFNYQDHENFLKIIKKAKCKIMISNYDSVLYNKHLIPEYGWKRFEYETNTNIVGKKNSSRRLEVLWYNY